jgi:hypothetical protein
MQYPVPQFTDVEDKIIGSLTLKQFGIIFGVGVIIFLAYSSTKSILVAVFFFILFGVPGLGLAFAKINGRPLYNTLGLFAKFLSSPKVLIFHKEAGSLSNTNRLKDAGLKTATVAVTPTVLDPQANLKKVQELLKTTSDQERETASKL